MVEGDTISFKRALAPTGQPQWKDISVLDDTYAISFAASEDIGSFPSYHSTRGIIKIQLSSLEEVSSDGCSAHGNTSILILHGTIMLLSFGILIPVGIFYARFYQQAESWLDIHKMVCIGSL